MEIVQPRFSKYLLVCENIRDKDDCCAQEGMNIRETLKALVKQKGLTGKIRVSRTGCQDACSEGPNVLLMPDNVWFKRVRTSDAEAILEQAMKGLS